MSGRKWIAVVSVPSTSKLKRKRVVEIIPHRENATTKQKFKSKRKEILGRTKAKFEIKKPAVNYANVVNGFRHVQGMTVYLPKAKAM